MSAVVENPVLQEDVESSLAKNGTAEKCDKSKIDMKPLEEAIDPEDDGEKKKKKKRKKKKKAGW